MGIQPEGPTVRRLLMIAGMATAWMPVMDRLLFPISFAYASTGDTAAYLYSIIYSILVIFITLAIGILSCRFAMASLSNRFVVLATGVGGAVGIAMASFLGFASWLPALLVGVGVALVALYVPVHFLFWSRLFSRADDKRTLSDAALSFVLASLVFALATTAGFDTLPIAIAAPFASGVMGFACAPLGGSAVDAPRERLLPRKMNVLTVSLVLILLCNIAIAYFNNSAKLQAQVPYRSLIFWGQTVAFAIVAYLYWPGKTRKLATMGAFAVVSLVFVGMLSLAVFVSGSLLNVGTVPLNCANTLLMAFVWLVILRYANRAGKSMVFLMSMYLACIVFLSRFVQACVMYESGYLTLFAQSINYVYLVAVITFLAVCLVIAALFGAFSAAAKSEGSASGALAEPDAAAFPPSIAEEHIEDARRAAQSEAVLRSLQERAGLSDRELEVALLALKNYSAKKMAQTLFVSENTVYSHLKHIYQKTEVHSKQEFIDLIEAQLPQG